MIVLIPYNKLEVNLNFKNIDRDFYTYEVSKPENKWFRKSFFDFPVSEMKARSVVYEYGPSFFVLFNKSGLSAEEIRRQLEAQDADARIRRLDQNALTALPTHLSTQLILRQYRINATIRIIQQVPSKNCG